MHRSTVSGTVLAAALLLLSAAAVAAPTGLGLGFHGGYGKSKDAESGSALIGAHAEIRPASFLAVHGSIDYKLDEDAIVKLEGGQNVEYTVNSVPISVTGRLYIPVSGFSPFVSAGAQWRYIQYDFGKISEIVDNFEADDSETAFGWLVGAGAEIAASPTFALFGEARFEFVDADRDLGNAADAVDKFDYDQWHVLGGLTWFLQ